VLGAAGYRCGYIGKWHLGGIPRSRFIPPGPERLGFDDFWASWNCSHDYFAARYHRDTPEPILIAGRYEPEAQTDLALEFITASNKRTVEKAREPWCLFVSYGPPHEPYRPLPPGYEGLYDPPALSLRPNCPDTAKYRQDLADYYTHLTALDDQVGRLLSALRECGELDRTLVVFTSDHGSMLGSHGRENKHGPWDEATVVPLLMRLGAEVDVSRRGVDDLLIGHVDLAPTLLGLLGLAPDKHMEGLDLSAYVLGARDGRPSSIYLHAVICADQAMKDGLIEWRGVRTSEATYAENLHGPWLLYDNVMDPFQHHNLIPGGTGPDRALRAHLQRELAEWMARTGDRLESKEAVLARYELTKTWEERAAHNRGARGTLEIGA